MKNYFIIFLLFTSSITLKAQNSSVENSVSGIQIGVLGVWAHNEMKLSNSIVLRTEIGFDIGYLQNVFYDVNGFLAAPTISIAPRWYYNLNKRSKKSKRIDGNSGNFLSLKLRYHPDWFVISDIDNISVIGDIGIFPTWGIRRNIGSHFNYETGIGLGFSQTFTKRLGYQKNQQETEVNLHLRVGYRF